MSYLIILATLSLAVAGFLHFYSKWKYSYWKNKGVLQLRPQFFFGNIKTLMKGDRSMAETFREFYNEFKRRDVKFAGVYMGFRAAFVPIDTALIKDMMRRNFDHFTAHFPKFKTTIFNMGLFHLEGEIWRQTRKQLTPTFTSGKMRMMLETLLEKTTGLGNLIAECAEDTEPTNIKEMLLRFTSDVVGSCGFGVECNALRDPDSEFVIYGRKIFEPPKKKFSYWRMFLRLFGRLQIKDLNKVERFFKNVVSETIAYREKHNVYRKDFLQLMIELKNTGKITDSEKISNILSKPVQTLIDDDYITAQCMIFFIAGYETSATTMSFALLELAQNQDIQEKVRQEALEVLKRHDGKITYDAMMELVYTEQVIEETLRKYPPVATIPRVCTKDYIVPGTDVVIEKGTEVHIPAWGLHMDPDYFPNPEKFDPERFNETNRKNIQDFTYLPFGEGPRMCLGLRFGMMQTKVGLISLIKDFKFTLNKKTVLPLKYQRHSFITTADGGIWVDISKV